MMRSAKRKAGIQLIIPSNIFVHRQLVGVKKMTLDTMQGPEGADGVWLPLVEYSLKSGVSLSTIRRKIKTNTIPFRLEKGKYLILFSGEVQETVAATPAPIA